MTGISDPLTIVASVIMGIQQKQPEIRMRIYSITVTCEAARELASACLR